MYALVAFCRLWCRCENMNVPESVPPEPVTIEKLPDEILEQIFSFLKLPDRKSASLVCHRWNNNAFQWKNIVVVPQSQNELEYSLLLNSDRPYKHLEVPARWLTPEMSAKYGGSLKSLTLFQAFKYGLEAESLLHRTVNISLYDIEHVQVNATFPKLRELTLENLMFWDHSGFNRFIRAAFPALACLNVNHCLISSSIKESVRFSNLTTLEQLKLKTKLPLGSTLLQDVESLPKLRSLEIICAEFKIHHLRQSFHLNHVTSLSIEAQFDEDFLLTITNLFPALTSLRLKGSMNFTMESIATARKELPNCAFKFEHYDNDFFKLN